MTNVATTRAGFATEGTFVPDSLIAGDFPIRTRKVTILSGQNLQRGAVLGVVTASGKYKLTAAASSDGSEAPSAILAEDVDATAADAEGVVYISGDFNEEKLILGAGVTIDDIKEPLRALNIYLHTPIEA